MIGAFTSKSRAASSAWHIASKGRKHEAGTALFDGDGELCGAREGRLDRTRRFTGELTHVYSSCEAAGTAGACVPCVTGFMRICRQPPYL